MNLRKMVTLTLAFCLVATLQSSLTAETLLVSSKTTNQVLKYDVDTGVYQGVFAEVNPSVTYDVGGTTRTVLADPTDIQIYDGKVYVAFRDDLNNSNYGGIACYSLDGTYEGLFTDASAYGTIMNFAFDASGDIIAGYWNGNTHSYNKIWGPGTANAGQLVEYLGKSGVGLAGNPAVDEAFYFGSSSTGKVFLTDTDPTTATHYVTYGPLSHSGTEEDVVYDLELSSDGKLYAIACVGGASVNGNLQNIYVCDLNATTPTFSYLAKYSDASPALDLALGMAFDSAGNLLVANSREDTIAKFSTVDGSFLGNLVDNTTGSEGHLDQPYYGLAVLPANVPEPSTFALLASALLGLLVWRRKK